MLAGFLFQFCYLISSHAQAQNLSLENYRALVQSNDPGYEGSILQNEGAVKVQESQDALTDTQVFLNLSNTEDKRPTQNPAFQGQRTDVRQISLGFSKQMEFGPSLKVSQNISHTTIFYASPAAIPEPNFYDAYPMIEASFPLWRNLFGSETKAELGKTKSNLEIKRIQNEIQWVRKTASIDMVFFTHAAHQENVNIQNEILDRAEKILSWAKSQKSRGLVDSSDVYQAQAAVTLRRLELENAQNELRASARQLNDLRGIDSDVVKEELKIGNIDLSKLKQNDKVNKVRKEDRIELAQMEMQDYDFKSARQKSNPNLDLVVKSEWVGRDHDYSGATQEMTSKDQPLYYVGLNFSMPLNAMKYIRVRNGLSQLSRGQSLILESKRRDQSATWKNFVDTGKVLYQRIEMLRDLEQVQKLKSDAERVRVQRGRSTTFQVLTFEQDYISARSQRILAELSARQYITQLPLFE